MLLLYIYPIYYKQSQRLLIIQNTDGQHRLKFITELIQNRQSKFIYNESVPITLILKDQFQQCQTYFENLAEAKPVDRSLLLSFSLSSAKSGITKNLI